jgi:hypothetical protein
MKHAWIILVPFLVGGCDTSMPAPVDDAAQQDGAIASDASTPRDAGPLPDANRTRDDNDGNTTFEEAISITIGGTAASGDLTGPDDYDYVRFEATAGQWIAVIQPRNDNSNPWASAWPVLLGPDMRPLAEANDARGCSGIEDLSRELVTRVRESGTYYVELNSGPVGHNGETLPWNVRVVDLSSSSASLVVEEGIDAQVTEAHRCVLGAFETADDVDALALNVPAYRTLFIEDPSRHGSTGTVSMLELRDGSDTLMGRSSSGLLLDDVPGSSVRLLGPVTSGSNDHYVLLVAGPFYYRHTYWAESAESTNDSFATPELLPTPPPPDESGYLAPFILHVGPDDVDHIAIDVTTTSQLTIECIARGLGTSVRDLEVRLLDDNGATVALGRESGMNPARISRNLEAGRHILRFSAPRHAPELSGTGAACTVQLDSSAT